MATHVSSPTGGKSQHRAGHVFGDMHHKTSIGNGHRKRGSYKNTKPYRGQGRR